MKLSASPLLHKTRDTADWLDRQRFPECIATLNRALREDPTLFDLASRLMECDMPEPFPPFMINYLIDLYKLEIEEGNHHAMNNLGAHYYSGNRGFEQSFTRAVELYTQAAESGNRQAQENLGYCYYYGRDMPVDYEKAFHAFALGALTGSTVSLYKLGDMYLNGYYVKQNPRQAFLIFSQCIRQMSDEDADQAAGPVHLRLGRMWLQGLGTPRDPELALSHFSAAEHYLLHMVLSGDPMYKKSLAAAVRGQAEARELLKERLTGEEWRFDD